MYVRPGFNPKSHFKVERIGRDEAQMNGSFRPEPERAEQDWHKRRDRQPRSIQERNTMNKTLLSLSAVATLVIGATAMTAQAAPAGGSSLQVNAATIQNVGWDGDRGWGDDRRWRHRHRDWDDRGSWRRRSWWWRHYYRGGRGWRGDRDYGYGDHRDYREHRRGDWR